MNSTCSRLQDDWELYALGSLPEETERAMAAHLESGCGDCRERYNEAQTAVTAMSNFVPVERPSPNVERKLMKAIRAERGIYVNEGSLWRWPFWKVVPWAAAFACLTVTMWMARDRNRLQADLADWRQRELVAERDRKAMQEELRARVEVVTAASGETGEKSTAAAHPEARSNDENRLKAELDAVLRQVEVSEADKAQWQRQADQLRTDLSAANDRAAALEKDLRAANERVAKEQEQERVARKETEQNAALAAELEKTQAEVRRLSAAATDGERVERLLQSSSLRQISLRSVVGEAGHATARALYSPQGGLWLMADSLPKLPDQKCYQLWLIRKGAPSIVSGGLIKLQDDGKGTLFAPPSADLAEVTALAITDEPAGGSVAARGKKLLFGAE